MTLATYPHTPDLDHSSPTPPDALGHARALLEQALNALLLPCDRWNKQQFKLVTAAAEAIRAELAKPIGQCWCDAQGIGEPGVSCGDCPTRDYKSAAELTKPATAPEPAWHDAPEVAALKAELERTKNDYQRACGLVADMHAAAVGEMTGPRLGVVEDVAALKAERDAAMKDAERYRWCVSNNMVLSGGSSAFGWPIAPVGRAEWDRYIDAAITKTEGRKE